MSTCVCCQREIAGDDVCSDCMRAVIEVIESRTTVLDVMAEFDLTPEQAVIVLGATAAWPEKRHVPRYMAIPESVARAVDRLPELLPDPSDDPRDATLTDDEQRERFASYGEPGDRD